MNDLVLILLLFCVSVKFLEFIRPFCAVLPEIAKPDRKVSITVPDITKLNSLFANGFLFLVASMSDQGQTTKGGES